jgi:hypothetical protein
VLGALVVAHRLEHGLVLGQRAANSGVVDVINVADMAGVLQCRPDPGGGPPAHNISGQVLQAAPVLRGIAADKPQGRRRSQVAEAQTTRFAVVVLFRQGCRGHHTARLCNRPTLVAACSDATSSGPAAEPTGA